MSRPFEVEKFAWSLIEHFARKEFQAKSHGDVKDAARQREVIDQILRELKSQSIDTEQE